MDSKKANSFFFKQELDGITLHYTSATFDDKNQRHHNWLSMPLKTDSIQALREHGRLPPTRINELFKEMTNAQEMSKLEEKYDEKTQEVNSMQEKIKEFEAFIAAKGLNQEFSGYNSGKK